MMKEIHGVVARDYIGNDVQVMIADTGDSISLYYTDANTPRLTAEEARFLAVQLVKAAQRLEKRKKP